jgi:hypothetical protein
MEKLTTKEFIEKAQKIHGDKFDYSLVKYVNNKIKVKIICKEHGEFEQQPSTHLLGRSGCKKCHINSIRSNTEEFIQKAKDIHGDKCDYSLVEYVGSKVKVKIICKEHGIFEQTPVMHMAGQNCPKCSIAAKFTQKKFVEKAKAIHGDKYDYSETIYNGAEHSVKIFCKKCNNTFVQVASSHMKGWGCNECSKKAHTLSVEEFINRAIKKHGDKYDYSSVNYKRMDVKVDIFCKKCKKYFQQTPHNHMFYGCKNCSSSDESKGEKEIKNFLEKLNISFIQQKMFDDCKNINKLPFDFYLPHFNTCIEFDGKQHFKPIGHWGGEDGLKSIQKRDKIKTEYCKLNNIPLIRISYKDNIEYILNKTLQNFGCHPGVIDSTMHNTIKF